MSAPARSRVPTLLTLALLATVATACGGGSSTGDPAQAPAPTTSRPADQQKANAVEGSDMQRLNVQSIEEYLNGRVPGLQVLRSESGQYTIRIRGNASAEGEPLLVVDNVPVTQGMNSDALRNLNPREIARVEVLKDASATAMYGSRGANGVLVIKTRRQ
jgi:TonB-dependent SusC/RagA subfamily outer membrane receptor